MGILYVVATPIGNLGDVSPRSIETLRQASLIVAEDTRHTLMLLRHLGIAKRMISAHGFNERSRQEQVLTALGEGDVALVTDAGTPGISDPGSLIVDAAISAGFVVSPIPGPSSLTAAVSASGLVHGPFTFVGFLPRQAKERRIVLARALSSRLPFVIFEAPGRTATTLTEISAVSPHRRAVVARELTKIHEEIVRDTVSSLASRFAATVLRGEVVIVIDGGEASADADDSPRDLLATLLGSGMSVSEAAREASKVIGRPRSEIYSLALEIKSHGSTH